MRATPLLLLALLLQTPLPQPAPAHDATIDMARAANALLAALSDEQRALTTIPFASDERTNWHYVPRSRQGLPFKQMSDEQRLLTHALIAAGLSEHGYAKATNIMSLETVLAALENNPQRRDPELYYLTVFGDPEREPWGWRVEGHHLSLNFTFAAGATAVTTPQFFGANPATIRSGPRTGFRTLPGEEDLARSLVQSLSEEQRARALILPQAPYEIFNEPGRSDTKPEGIAWGDLDGRQRELLLSLIREYTHRFRADVADEKLAALEAAGFDKLHFAWAGSIEKGEAHYYRVQGGTFVLEYDNIQNGANHIHSVWRDFDRDFGADLLAEHYRNAHQP